MTDNLLPSVESSTAIAEELNQLMEASRKQFDLPPYVHPEEYQAWKQEKDDLILQRQLLKEQSLSRDQTYTGRERYLERLSTYSAPFITNITPISPDQCAMHGWSDTHERHIIANSEIFRLSCKNCSALLDVPNLTGVNPEFTSVKRIYSLYPIFLNKNHSESCFWRTNSCHVSVCAFPLVTTSDAYSLLESQGKLFQQWQNELPLVDNPYDASQMRMIHRVIKAIENIDVFGYPPQKLTNIQETAYLLPMFGWHHFEKHNQRLLKCLCCFRHAFVPNYLQLNDQPSKQNDSTPTRSTRSACLQSTFHPINEHRTYCPWRNRDIARVCLKNSFFIPSKQPLNGCEWMMEIVCKEWFQLTTDDEKHPRHDEFRRNAERYLTTSIASTRWMTEDLAAYAQAKSMKRSRSDTSETEDTEHINNKRQHIISTDMETTYDEEQGPEIKSQEEEKEEEKPGTSAVITPTLTTPTSPSLQQQQVEREEGESMDVSQPSQQQPEQLQPEQLQPEQLQPEQLHPEQLQPEQQQPEQLQPEQLQPEQLQPEQLQPEQQQPEQQQPEQQQPEQQQPEQQQPEQQQPEQQQPEQLQPEQLQPEQLQPEQLQPEQLQPEQLQPEQLQEPVSTEESIAPTEDSSIPAISSAQAHPISGMEAVEKEELIVTEDTMDQLTNMQSVTNKEDTKPEDATTVVDKDIFATTEQIEPTIEHKVVTLVKELDKNELKDNTQQDQLDEDENGDILGENVSTPAALDLVDMGTPFGEDVSTPIALDLMDTGTPIVIPQEETEENHILEPDAESPIIEITSQQETTDQQEGITTTSSPEIQSNISDIKTAKPDDILLVEEEETDQSVQQETIEGDELQLNEAPTAEPMISEEHDINLEESTPVPVEVTVADVTPATTTVNADVDADVDAVNDMELDQAEDSKLNEEMELEDLDTTTPGASTEIVTDIAGDGTHLQAADHDEEDNKDISTESLTERIDTTEKKSVISDEVQPVIIVADETISTPTSLDQVDIGALAGTSETEKEDSHPTLEEGEVIERSSTTDMTDHQEQSSEQDQSIELPISTAQDESVEKLNTTVDEVESVHEKSTLDDVSPVEEALVDDDQQQEDKYAETAMTEVPVDQDIDLEEEVNDTMETKTEVSMAGLPTTGTQTSHDQSDESAEVYQDMNDIQDDEQNKENELDTTINEQDILEGDETEIQLGGVGEDLLDNHDEFEEQHDNATSHDEKQDDDLGDNEERIDNTEQPLYSNDGQTRTVQQESNNDQPDAVEKNDTDNDGSLDQYDDQPLVDHQEISNDQPPIDNKDNDDSLGQVDDNNTILDEANDIEPYETSNHHDFLDRDDQDKAHVMESDLIDEEIGNSNNDVLQQEVDVLEDNKEEEALLEHDEQHTLPPDVLPQESDEEDARTNVEDDTTVVDREMVHSPPFSPHQDDDVVMQDTLEDKENRAQMDDDDDAWMGE